jgi:hypothetical protein
MNLLALTKEKLVYLILAGNVPVAIKERGKMNTFVFYIVEKKLCR